MLYGIIKGKNLIHTCTDLRGATEFIDDRIDNMIQGESYAIVVFLELWRPDREGPMFCCVNQLSGDESKKEGA